MMKTCVQCGSKFIAVGKASICSQECRKARKIEYGKVHTWKPIKRCWVCGVKTKNLINRKYCSDDCCQEARERRLAIHETCECGAPAVERQAGKWLCRACMCADEVDFRSYWIGLASGLQSISGRDTLCYQYSKVI